MEFKLKTFRNPIKVYPPDITSHENRHALVKSIIEKIENGFFVEIGTHLGDFADFILQNSSNSTLYCIDPYISYDDYDDAINNTTGDNYYNSTYDKLKSKYGERVIFIRKLSTEAINDIPNEIDFLYVDGNHRYTYVLKDLELFYQKVKQNCYIVGDDAVDTDETKRNANGDVLVSWSHNSYGHYGVIKAFTEFCKNNNLNGQKIGNQYVIHKIIHNDEIQHLDV